MNEVDETGWAHIHHASQKGYFKSVEKFIKAHEDQLEFQTQDELAETPLLIAIRTGMSNIETIEIILDLGGNTAAINNLNHGLVEICCLEGHYDLLEYLTRLDKHELPVWSILLRFFTSDLEDEALCAGQALSTLTNPTPDINPNWRCIYDNKGIATLVKVINGSTADEAKTHGLQCLINMLSRREVKDQVVSSGGLDCIVWLLKSSTDSVVKLSCTALSLLCEVKTYAEQASQKSVLVALVNILRKDISSDVVIEAVNAIGIICESSDNRKQQLHNTSGGISSICDLFQRHSDPNLFLATCKCVSKISRRFVSNQDGFVESGGAPHIIYLIDIKNKDIQLAAVDTIHMLVEANPKTQDAFKREGVISPLINLLNKSKSQIVQEKTAGALWALAGEQEERRRSMAGTIGVYLLIDFLSSLSEILHFIGSEGLGVLAQGAHNKQDAIAEANGVHPLVRLLKSDKEYLVLSSIRSIRHLCVGVGYLPHRTNQGTVSQARGIKLLTALLALSTSEIIQVESALTLAYVAVGNPMTMQEIWKGSPHVEFNYNRILKLLYSPSRQVKLLAGAALACFAYNNRVQQQMIAAEGGIRFSCFEDFLQADDEYKRCNAAFQVVVLARIIPDEEQAVVTAAGIKLIGDILAESQSKVIQALAADCIARLAHTRSGIPQAFVAIDCVQRLCELVFAKDNQVRGCSSIALAYLSFNHLGERQLLNKCRSHPFLIRCLLYYTDKHPLSKKFKKEWKHYKKVGGLPAISEGRPCLVSKYGQRTPAFQTPPEVKTVNTSKPEQLGRMVSESSSF